MSDEQEQAPPMGVQVILTAEAEVIRGGRPAGDPDDESDDEADDEEQA